MPHKAEIEMYERITRIEYQLKKLDDIEKSVESLEQDLLRYRGVIGGILLAVTAIGTALKMFGKYLTDLWI